MSELWELSAEETARRVRSREVSAVDVVESALARTARVEPLIHAWLELFEETVRLGWTGPRAEQALELAHRVADVHERALVSGKRVWMPVAVAGA